MAVHGQPTLWKESDRQKKEAEVRTKQVVLLLLLVTLLSRLFELTVLD